MEIRKAKPSDFNELYRIGKATPELKISKNEVFMSKEDFMFAIKNKNGIFFVAKEKEKIIGFAYCAIEGPDYACMIYNVLLPKYRGKGIGGKLSKAREDWLRKKGIKSVYVLATNSKVVKMLTHMKYKRGKTLTWMEKKL